MVFGAYRRDDFADPESFALQVGLVLERYPDSLIEFVTDPRTGIQRQCKWPPTIAEIVQACEAEAQSRATRKRYENIPPPRLAIAGGPQPKNPRYNLLIRPGSTGYDAMIERAKTANAQDYKITAEGIWVPLDWWATGKSVAGPGQFTKADFDSLATRWGGRGGEKASAAADHG